MFIIFFLHNEIKDISETNIKIIKDTWPVRRNITKSNNKKCNNF